MKETQIPTSPLGFIFYITKKHKFALALAAFFVFFTELMFAITPVILGRIVDLANAYGESGGPELGTIAFFVLLYPLIRLLMISGIRGSGYVLTYLTAYMRTETYRVLFSHLSLHSNSFFSNRFAGSLSSDVSVVGQNMIRITRFFTFSFLGLLVAVVAGTFVIASASIKLALLYILGIALLVPFNYFLSKKTIKLSRAAVKTLSTLKGHVVDSITNISAVQEFAMRDRELKKLDESVLDNQNADIKAGVYSENVLFVNNILIMGFAALVMYGAFVLWSSGSMSLGQFVMILTLVMTIIRSLSFIGNSINEFSGIYGQTKQSLGEILTAHDIVDKKDAKALNVQDGRIQFENVDFSYDTSSAVFKNLSLTIQAGERIGVVGSSGGGKTTLVKLLLRQHDIDGGVILIDEQNITDITQNSLREAIGIVPQEPLLFHRSLKENIAYGKPDASFEEIQEAAKKALIHDFIESLPEKYETFTGERGIKLSGGQRQRVAIARAILKAAPVLVLDEATSALDSESERCVQEGLKKLMQGKTVIAIAHRLSTIKEMDRIIVFESGKIVQDGPHDELLKDENGVYARLWSHQAGGFLQEEENLKVI